MKVIIPVDEARPDSPVCVSFGRAPYFLLCEGGKTEFVDNPGAQAEGGAGLKAAQAAADSGQTRSSPSAAVKTPPKCSRPSV